MSALTPKQFEVVALVYRAETAGRPISLRELTEAIGVRSTYSTTCRLRGIRARGQFIDTALHKARTMHVVAVPVFAGDPPQLVDFIPRRAA